MDSPVTSTALTPAQRRARWRRLHPEQHAAQQAAYRARKRALRQPVR